MVRRGYDNPEPYSWEGRWRSNYSYCDDPETNAQVVFDKLFKSLDEIHNHASDLAKDGPENVYLILMTLRLCTTQEKFENNGEHQHMEQKMNDSFVKDDKNQILNVKKKLDPSKLKKLNKILTDCGIGFQNITTSTRQAQPVIEID